MINPKETRSVSPVIQKILITAVKMMMNRSGLMERMMSFGEIPVRSTNPTEAAVISKKADTLFARKITTIYKSAIMILNLGSSLCISELPSQYCPNAISDFIF